MQRREVDRQEYEAIRDELMERVDTPGIAPLVDGVHAKHGRVILRVLKGRYWCDAEDVSLVRTLGIGPD